MRKVSRVGLPFLLGLLAAVTAVLGGCPSSYDPGNGTPDSSAGTGGTPQQNDELFVQQSDPQNWHFTTADTAYWGPSGYTLWSLSLPDQEPFAQREVSLVKTSGNAWAGFGLVLSHVDSAGAALESMLLVMINTQQQYTIGEVNGSHFNPYTSPTWVTSPNLTRGYGGSNDVKVTRDAGGQFTLYLNQVQTATFRDGRTDAPDGGGNGFLVVISPQDSFPQIPVSVSFTEK